MFCTRTTFDVTQKRETTSYTQFEGEKVERNRCRNITTTTTRGGTTSQSLSLSATMMVWISTSSNKAAAVTTLLPTTQKHHLHLHQQQQDDDNKSDNSDSVVVIIPTSRWQQYIGMRGLPKNLWQDSHSILILMKHKIKIKEHALFWYSWS